MYYFAQCQYFHFKLGKALKTWNFLSYERHADEYNMSALGAYAIREKNCKFLQRLNAFCIRYATRCQNFNLKLRIDHRKFLDEHRAYESVDDWSLSYVTSQQNNKTKISKIL